MTHGGHVQNLHSGMHVRFGRVDEPRGGAFRTAVFLLVTWGTGLTSAWGTRPARPDS